MGGGTFQINRMHLDHQKGWFEGLANLHPPRGLDGPLFEESLFTCLSEPVCRGSQRAFRVRVRVDRMDSSDWTDHLVEFTDGQGHVILLFIDVEKRY